MKFKEYYTRTFPQEIMETKDFKIYIDMDGVLCNFEKGIFDIDGKTTLADLEKKEKQQDEENEKVFWNHIGKKDSFKFYSELEWHPEGKQIWNYLKDKPNIQILSSLGRKNPDKDKTQKGKELWLKNNNINIPQIFTQQATDKQKFANKNAILIDDYNKNIDEWTKAGGIGILFKTADEAIKQLKQLGENIVIAPNVVVPDNSTMIDPRGK